MNFFDIIFIVLLVVLLIFGIKKGALREMFSFLGCFAGYVGAVKYYLAYYHHLLPYITNQLYAKVVTYVLIFILGLVVGMLLSWLSKAMLSNRKPVFLSRVVAGLFSIAKSALISFVIMFTVETCFQAMLGDDLSRSFLYSTLVKTEGLLKSFIF